MVKQQRLRITLHDDALFSASSATEGGLRTLDYIPGAALLGAAAARCYDKCGDPWILFHSGAIRFGDGLPLHRNGLCAWPAPLTWQIPKEGEHLDSERRLQVALTNAAAGDLGHGEQRKPLRGTCITADGHTVRLAHRISLKTAIDPGTKRIATGQLFQYESLVGNTEFVATISWDSEDGDGHDELADGALEALCRSALALGRSRSAEYGGATVQRLGPAVLDWPRLDRTAEATHISLWCLSDLCLLDTDGQPCLSPTSSDLGLPPGELVASRSYIQTRTYSPFNAHRQAYDMERQVIARGSVLTIKFHQPQVIKTIADQVAAGVGLHREAGLGVISVDHAWQTESTFDVSCTAAFSELVARLPMASPTTAPTATDSAFIQWLSARCNVAVKETERREWAKKQYLVVQRILTSAAQLSSQPAELSQPSATQWGSVSQLAKDAKNKSALIRSLTEPNGPLYGAVTPGTTTEGEVQKAKREKARSKRNGEWFAAAFLLIDGPDGMGARSQPTRLGDWLIAEIGELSDDDSVGEYVGALAALARTAAQGQRDVRASAPLQEHNHGQR